MTRKVLKSAGHQTPPGAADHRKRFQTPFFPRRTIGKDIQRLEFEWPVGMPHCRPLGNGLWEVRSRISDGRLGRVIFCVSERRLLLLHGFIKKTAKTPRQDIDLASRRMQEGLS